MATKEIKKHLWTIDEYGIYIPVYYLGENRPSWRRYYAGTLDECKALFQSAPDYVKEI